MLVCLGITRIMRELFWLRAYRLAFCLISIVTISACLDSSGGAGSSSTENTSSNYSVSISSSSLAVSSIGAISSLTSSSTASDPAGNSSEQSNSAVSSAPCSTQEVNDVLQRNNCVVCHSASLFAGTGGGLNLEASNLGQSLLNRPTQYGGTACTGELIINVSDPADSLILKLTEPSRHLALNATGCLRQPMPQSGQFMPAADYACLTSWVYQVAENEIPVVTEPHPSYEFAPTNAGMALAKAKYLLHGGAPTEAELELLGGSQVQLDPMVLRQIIRQWSTTDEYQTKIKDFLQSTLQQRDLGDSRYNEQFGNIRSLINKSIDDDALRSNFAESFVRTAWQIVQQNQDFREVIRTRQWQVTTALLAALVYLDKPNQSEDRSYQEVSRMADLFRALDSLQASDYQDWRTVTLAPSSTPASWLNDSTFTQNLRAIANGGTLPLRYPRIGFFSTPVFLNTWVTNDDNRFRLTLNQTLIVALNRNFLPSDTTPHLSENGIPPSHVDPNLICYQCHRHMDPMRLVFDNVLVTRYRSKAPEQGPNVTPSFSFYGVSKPISSMEDFAAILVDHPQFAVGWVQKLCVWGNSTLCDESDPEFVRLVDSFKSSGFKLANLLEEFFSSAIFTGSYQTPTQQNKNFIISLSRSNHLCRALAARINQINRAAGTSGTLNLCRTDEFGLVPSDEYSRGEVNLVQALNLGMFDAKSIDRECSRVASKIYAADNSALFVSSAPVAENLSYMVRYLMATPKNHHRYAELIAGLQRVYDLTTKPKNCTDPLVQTGEIQCGYGANSNAGLRSAWFAACTSPELIGIGM